MPGDILQNPVMTVYRAFSGHDIKFLLIGGQAAIFYGAAQFTRDTDFCVFCDAANLAQVHKALGSLSAVQVFFPPLEIRHLLKGHACHFEAGIEPAKGFRIDIMAKLTNCPSFEEMWEQRNEYSLEGLRIPVIALKHLVAAKKTQRDKDWPIVRRLVEVHYELHNNASEEHAEWWFLESRTPEMLKGLFKRFPETAMRLAGTRPLLLTVKKGDSNMIEEALMREELALRRADKAFWEPLRRELEEMRHGRERA